MRSLKLCRHLEILRSVAMRGSVWVFVFLLLAPIAGAAVHENPVRNFPTPVESYGDGGVTDLGAKLLGRVCADPFNALATAIFLAAIVHTFLAAKFRAISHRFEHECEVLERRSLGESETNARLASQIDHTKFFSVLFHFLGEVEAALRAR